MMAAVLAAPPKTAAHILRRAVAVGSFLLALLAAITAIWLFYLQPWLKLTPPFAEWFEKNRCLLPRFCVEPVWLDHPLGTALVVAAIFFCSLGLVIQRQGRVTAAVAPSDALDTPWLVLVRLAVASSWLVAILWQAYLALVKGAPPHGALWLGGMGLALALALAFEPPAALGGIGESAYALLTGLGIVGIVIGLAALQAGQSSMLLALALVGVGLFLFCWGAERVDQAGAHLPWRYSLTLLLLTILMLELGLARAWAWQLAYIGDEWAFYDWGFTALHNVQPWHWFEIRGYNGYFAAFSSQMIGWSLQLFGDTIYGWRLASLLPLVIAVPALYVIGEWLLGKEAGLLAAGLFAVQHSLLQFAMVPYNNTQAMPVIAISLALLLLALRRNSPLLYGLVGLVAGCSFITYASARLVFISLALLLAFHGWPSWRRWFTSTFFIGVGALASAAPMLFNLTNWQSLLKATPLQSEVAGAQLSVVDQVIRNVFAGLLVFALNPTNTHYVIGPLVDPLTILLVLLGVAFLMANGWRERRYLSWLLASLAFIVLVSGIQQYERIATTRVFVSTFFYAIFAGVGAALLPGLGQGKGQNKSTLGPVTLICVIALVNQLHIAKVAMPALPISPPALLIQQAQRLAATPNADLSLYVVWPEVNMRLINLMLRAYALNGGRIAFLQPTELLNATALCQGADQPQMVLLHVSAADYAAMVDHLRDCWPTATQDHLTDQAGQLVYTRFLTPAAQAQMARTPGALYHATAAPTWRHGLRKAERIAIDGQNVLYGIARSQALLYRLDLTSGQFDQFTLVQQNPHDLAITPDGLLLVAAADKKLVWYDAGGAPVRMLPPTEQVGALVALAVTQQGEIYAADPDNYAIAHFSAAGELRRRLTGGGKLGQPAMLALSPDEKALWSLDAVAGRLYQLAPATDQVVAEMASPFSNPDWVGRLAVTNQNTLLTLAPEQGQLYELTNAGRVVHSYGGLLRPMDLAATHDGRLLVTDWDADEVVALQVKGQPLPPALPRVRLASAAERLAFTAAEAAPLPLPAVDAPEQVIAPNQYTYYRREQLAGLVRAQALVIGPGGQIYVLDSAGKRIYILDQTGAVLTHLEQAALPFQELSDLDVDSQGNLYVLDAQQSVISVFDAAGNFRHLLAQAQGKLGVARGLTVAADGSIWVAATSLGQLLQLNADGAEQRAIPIGKDGSGQPVDVIVTSAGDLLVTEGTLGEILRFSVTGELLARQRIAPFNTAEGAHFAADPAGKLYVTNPESGALVRITEQGAIQQQWRFMLAGETRTKLIGADISAQGEIWATDAINGGLLRYKP